MTQSTKQLVRQSKGQTKGILKQRGNNVERHLTIRGLTGITGTDGFTGDGGGGGLGIRYVGTRGFSAITARTAGTQKARKMKLMHLRGVIFCISASKMMYE